MLKPVAPRAALPDSVPPPFDHAKEYQKLLQKFMYFSAMLQDKLSAMEEIHHYSKNVIYKEYEQLENMVINLQEHYQLQFGQLNSIIQEHSNAVQQKYDKMNQKWDKIFSATKQKCSEVEAENIQLKLNNRDLEDKITFLTQENELLFQENDKLKTQVKQWMDVSLLTIPMVNLLHIKYTNSSETTQSLNDTPSVNAEKITEEKLFSNSAFELTNVNNVNIQPENVNNVENAVVNTNGEVPELVCKFEESIVNNDAVKEEDESSTTLEMPSSTTKETPREDEDDQIRQLDPILVEKSNSTNLSSSLGDEEETLHSSVDGSSSCNLPTPRNSLIQFKEIETVVQKNVEENLYPVPDYSNFKNLQFFESKVQDKIIGQFSKADFYNGQFQNCSFNHPIAICAPSTYHLKPNYPYKGCLFVAEAGNQTIRMISNNSKTVSTILQFPYQTSFEPTGICLCQDGFSIIILDAKQNQIYIVDIETGAYSILFSTKELHKMKLERICDGILDYQNNTLYITHQAGLAKINLNTKKVSLIGRKVGYRDGLFEKCMFHNPCGLCFLDSSTLLVADSGNHSIRVVDLQNGIVETFCGTPYSGMGSIVTDGNLAEANFFYPTKIALSPRRAMLFITEQSNHVRIIDCTTQQVLTLQMQSELKEARGITFYEESKGISLYVCNSGHHCVTKVEMNM